MGSAMWEVLQWEVLFDDDKFITGRKEAPVKDYGIVVWIQVSSQFVFGISRTIIMSTWKNLCVNYT